MTFQKLQLVYHVKTTNNFSESLYKMAASLNFMKMRKKSVGFQKTFRSKKIIVSKMCTIS